MLSAHLDKISHNYMLSAPQEVLQQSHAGFYGWLIRVFQPLDNLIGPDKTKYKPACIQDKQIFLQCVMKSECYAQTQNFKHCVQEGIDKECKALRYNYYMCKRSLIFWHKAFNHQDPRRI